VHFWIRCVIVFSKTSRALETHFKKIIRLYTCMFHQTRFVWNFFANKKVKQKINGSYQIDNYSYPKGLLRCLKDYKPNWVTWNEDGNSFSSSMRKRMYIVPYYIALRYNDYIEMLYGLDEVARIKIIKE
jgi:hypothetical protein